MHTVLPRYIANFSSGQISQNQWRMAITGGGIIPGELTWREGGDIMWGNIAGDHCI